METNRRLDHIESIRAIAAIAVAIFHFTNFYSGKSFILTNEKVRSFFEYGAQGVEIFYVVSGFIITYSLYHSRYQITHYFKYLAKRFVRLLPPYYVTIGLILLVSFILNRFVWGIPFDLQVKNIFANATFAVDFIASSADLSAYFSDNGWINPIFETLKVEVQFYLLIGLLFPLINKNYLVLILFTVIFLILGVYTQSSNTFLVNSPYFLVGISCFYLHEKGWKWNYILPLILCFLCLGMFYVFQDLVVTMIALLLIFWLPNPPKFLKLTGKISYSYYLIHGLCGGQFLYFTSDWQIWHQAPYLMILFALLFSWMGAYLIYICIEKPSLKISKRIEYTSLK